jgi:pilus assembly protein FimV
MRKNKTWMLLGLTLAMPAQALDIEPIAVRSALGQPLLAEIPIQASPEELHKLRTDLAPPVVFARVGLPRPRGTVADLRFAIRDARGQPVIRVTTVEPVTEEFFTFLVQLEWSSGRMIREFSVALQEPSSLPMAAVPAIHLPEPAPPNSVKREPEPPAPPAPIEVTATAAIAARPEVGPTVPDTAAPAAPPATTPIPPQAPTRAAAAPPASVSAAAQVPPPSPTDRSRASNQTAPPPSPASPKPNVPPSDEDRYGPVKSGMTLSRIAARIDSDGSLHEQALVALLLANPDAFIDGNINRLMQGTTLRLPARSTLVSIDSAHARELVRLQIREWHEGLDAVPQPEMAAAMAAVKTDMQAAEESPVSPVPVPPASARLEIAESERRQISETPSEAGSAGTGTPDEAGLHQETLASRDTEIEYLKQRVVELEGSHDKQQHVITMQDQALATAQERLTQTTGRSAVSMRSPWLWSGMAGLLILGLLIGLRFRREKASSIDGRATTTSRLPRWRRS